MIDLSLLFEALCGCKKLIIVGHTHPDGDCVGSAIGLSFLCDALGIENTVAFPDSVPERLEFMLGGKRPVCALPEGLDNYDVVCVDVAAPKQLGVLEDGLCGRVKIRIDHHSLGTPYAAAEFVDSGASATGEIIFGLIEHAKDCGRVATLPTRAYEAVFGAISSDTGCFKYANVTPKTHMIAAKLFECGINAAEINRLLFDTKDAKELAAEKVALGKVKLYANGRIGAIGIDESDYKDGLEYSDFETSIYYARCVRTVRVALIAKAVGNGSFRISLRSNDETDVSEIAAKFGGGGHVRASGCTVNACSAEEAVQKVISEIEKIL